jgi:hypothetical protein
MHSKGVSWIDDCRIPFVENDGLIEHQEKYGVDSGYGKDTNTKFGQIKNSVICGSPQGRFPANILVCDDMLNDGVISKQNPRKYKADLDIQETSLLGFGDTKDKIQMGDKGSNSRYYNIDKWFENLIK